jgi:hypothetical protein
MAEIYLAGPAADPAAPAAGETQTPEQIASQERDEAGKFRKPVQPRIDELTRKARENEREAAYWRQRAEAKEKAEAEANAPKKPEPKDFEQYNDYVEALADFKADQKVDSKLDERDKAAAKAKAEQTRASTWKERAAKFAESAPDYHEVMQASDVPVAPHVIEALEDSDMGPTIAYHLAKNPEIADRLNAMSPTAAAREIGKLEGKLATDTAPTPDPNAETQGERAAPAAPAARAPKTTSAPPPAKPLSSGRSTSVDLSKAGMDDYVKTRASQGARWAR